MSSPFARRVFHKVYPYGSSIALKTAPSEVAPLEDGAAASLDLCHEATDIVLPTVKLFSQVRKSDALRHAPRDAKEKPR